MMNNFPNANVKTARHFHACPVCGKRISGTGATLCHKCALPNYPYEKGSSFAAYQANRKAMRNDNS